MYVENIQQMSSIIVIRVRLRTGAVCVCPRVCAGENGHLVLWLRLEPAAFDLFPAAWGGGGYTVPSRVL